MKLLGLPGRDQATDAWLRGLIQAVGDGQHEIAMPSYRHWDSEHNPDPAFEAASLAVSQADLVIAKSMGTMVLLELFAAGMTPDRAVLIGVPLVGYSATQHQRLSELVAQVPCLGIQQTDDFTGSFSALQDVLGDTAATLAEVPGADHVYSDTRLLAQLINDWLG